MRTYREIWGRRIRRAREAAGYSQRTLSVALDINQAVVSRWESGHTAPSDARRPIVAALLGVPAEVLFSYEPDEAVA